MSRRYVNTLSSGLAALGLSLLMLSASVVLPAPHAYAAPTVESSTAGTATAELAYIKRFDVDMALAPIHTRTELQEYLKITAASGSPLDALPPDAQQRFFSSLVFTARGLASFSYADLQYLSATKIYKILSLFGVQSVTPMIHGAQINDAADEAIMQMPVLPHDYDDYWCSSRATCSPSYSHICLTANCFVP